jgi:hypothetical protein
MYVFMDVVVDYDYAVLHLAASTNSWVVTRIIITEARQLENLHHTPWVTLKI